MNRYGSSPANFLLPLLTMKKLTSNVCGARFELGEEGEEWKLGLESLPPYLEGETKRIHDITILICLDQPEESDPLNCRSCYRRFIRRSADSFAKSLSLGP